MTMVFIPLHTTLKCLFVFSFLIVSVDSVCYTRRCLANELVNEDLLSAPQPPECVINVNLTSIQCETISLVTKTLKFTSRIKIIMEWNDPRLAWDVSQYAFNEILLPFDKIWTPNLSVGNAVSLTMKPISKDILVRSNGTVKNAIVMYITTECKLNLFTYPFVEDSCPVAISGWNQSSCGVNLSFGSLSSLGKGQGEWQTLSVELQGESSKYVNFYLAHSAFNALVSLVLPTGLIMVVDLVSFALPLAGERNPFKIKLVFSFTMFLLILSKQLPEGGPCSPLIYYHFCFCLLVLVISLLISMTLSRLAENGSILPGKSGRPRKPDSSENQEHTIPQHGKVEFKSSISSAGEKTSIQKISSFVSNMDDQSADRKGKQDYAAFWDKICFWTYLSLDIIYMICVIVFFKTQHCTFDKLDF
ncbi:5-hydroxytryptamine receptor 3A-like [Trichomycterus rosablanca]|uniref:5-hydroxytryptamine receptor 3A-like n=1 Tax=Trichomycterus rosablanca TaxID=2290929 RepID=UPI002F357E85